MKNLFYIFLLFLVLISSCKKEESPNPYVDELESIRGYKNFYLGTFRCGVFVPPSYSASKKYPLIIYLHGHTDTTTWNLEWYNEPIVTDDPCIVLTPKCLREEIYGWGDSFDPRTSPMMAKTYEVMDLAKVAYNLDGDRYYIYGTSMGGYGSYGAIQKNPGLFTAAYVKCGAGNPEIADMLVDFPLWIFHGSEDQAVPVHWSRDMYNAIVAIGGTQVKYTEYTGIGHNVWDFPRNEVFWILAQRKGAIHGIPDGISNFSGLINKQGHIVLNWHSPENITNADNQVWYCNIIRNNEIIKEVDSPLTSFIDSTVTQGNTYTYKVIVVNFFFMESEASVPITITIDKIRQRTGSQLMEKNHLCQY
jgi:pimeloyl-ACP methyl ester carboxylesterase